ncbi:MAG: hypothetical protein P0Y49_06825 [Candidatus Pedobacter colombiensis]|uniref:Ig-like domain-containing protein n=1 Tax=Candidatus Pedobacter colombiensis TaxID=3121371 RepID=A0AAJ5WBA2_9SPHI|nr:hypothetical protein [Pedobacter sp.]WEK20848.1 MAG: hypothetical protein P0Y49_06825 [Pedobacter sp.]
MTTGIEQVKGQKTYATIVSKTGTGVSREDKAKATDPTIQPTLSTPYANINISGTPGVLGGSANSASITLSFPSIPAGKFVYVRIANNTLSGGGGSFKAEAVNGSTVVPGASKLTIGPDGFTYYAVNASGTFTGVQITATGNGGLLGSTGTANIDILYAFYSTADCGITLGTDWSAGTLGGTVNNPQLAIDGNPDTYSTMAPNLLLSYVDQNFYFPESSTNPVTLTVSAPPKTGLSLGLLNNIIITAYNGASETKVWETGAGNLLSLDLLGLLGNGTPTTFTISPNVPFDRIKINYGSVANLFSEFYIREVIRTPDKPKFTIPTQQNITICSGTQATFTPDAPTSGNELRWYKKATGGTPTIGNSYTTSNLTATDSIYVAMAKTNCSGESERIKMKITINTVNPGSIGTVQTICAGTKPAMLTNVATGTGNGTVTYQWQKSTNDNTHYANINGATAQTFTESLILTQNTYYKRLATATLNGVSCSSDSNEILITVHPKPPTPYVLIN